jgi:class 3 adenylate cyclase
VTRLRQLGGALWIVFNFPPGERGIAATACDAIAFCRDVGAALRGEGMQCRVGADAEAAARAGMVSRDRLLFDLYGHAMNSAAALARKAAPGTAVFALAVAQYENASDLVNVKIEMTGMRLDVAKLQIQ